MLEPRRSGRARNPVPSYRDEVRFHVFLLVHDTYYIVNDTAFKIKILMVCSCDFLHNSLHVHLFYVIILKEHQDYGYYYY